MTMDYIEGGTSPMYYEIENDLINNRLTASIDASTISKQNWIYYSTAFDSQSGNDYIFHIFPDWHEVEFYAFDVEVSCTVCLLYIYQVCDVSELFISII